MSSMKLVQVDGKMIRDTVFKTISGPTSSGRTTYAFTAPDPILCFHSEIGKIEEPVNRAREQGKEVSLVDFSFTAVPGLSEKELSKTARDQFDEFASLLIALSPNYRSVLLDTHSDAYDLLRYARFGRLTNVKPTDYGPLNAEWFLLFKTLKHTCDCNFVAIGKQKEQYRGNQASGKMVPAGHKEMGESGYLTDVVLESYRRKDKKTGEVTYGVRVEKGWNRDDVAYGMDFDGEVANFTTVMQVLSPENAGVWA